MHKSIIAFNCDDVSPKTKAAKLRELLSIINRFDISATLFVIPKSHEQWSSCHPLAMVLRDAEADGHEIALHGVSHYPFETWNTTIRQKISMGLRILNDKLAINPKGFRAPYHQISRSLLQALNDMDFLYDSSYMALTRVLLSYVPPLRVIWFSRRAALTASNMFHPLNLKLWEIPITHEFTWYNLKLEVNCFQAFLRNNISQVEPNCFVIDSHIGALSKWGFHILRELFLRVKDNGLSNLTLQQLAERQNNLEAKAFYV